MIERHGLSQSSIESIAGFTAGTVSTLAVHPLDVIKTRLQINTYPRVGSLLHHQRSQRSLPSLNVFYSLLTSEGASPLRSLYRGLTPNLVGNSLGWSLYFLWYSQAQDAIRRLRRYPPNRSLSSLDYLAASLTSGVLSATLTNPIWVVKTRMLSTSAKHRGAYPSMIFGLRAIARQEGWPGYFRGLVPSLVGVSHSAVYFVAYEKLKAARATQIFASLAPSLTGEENRDGQINVDPKDNNRLSNTDYLLTSGASKILAGTLTYPHQVVRARMQTYVASSSPQVSSPSSRSRPRSGPGPEPHTSQARQHQQRRRLTQTISSIWNQDGLSGFYRGLGPNLLRVVPSTCVTFLVYENVRWALEGR